MLSLKDSYYYISNVTAWQQILFTQMLIIMHVLNARNMNTVS